MKIPLPALPLFALLSFACVEEALAFPPCPKAPLDLVPLESLNEGATTQTENGGGAPWYLARYAIVGDPSMIERTSSSDNPSTGKCTDRAAVPIPGANASTGTIGLSPSYASAGVFGTIALPDWIASTPRNGTIAYTFDFAIDDDALPDGAWIDLLQLELKPDGTGQFIGGRTQTSTLYRLRKLATGRYASALAMIESRMLSSDDKFPTDRIVAVLPLRDASGATSMRLRWTQTAFGGTTPRIDTWLEWSNGDGTPLYEAKLSNQWADLLSMGLLDYNLDEMPKNASPLRLAFSKMELSAE